MTFQVLKYCKNYCIFDQPSDYVPALPFKIFRSLAEFWPQERSVPDWFESIALHSFCCDLKIKMNYSQHWLPDLTGNKSSFPLPHLCSTNKRSLQLANLPDDFPDGFKTVWIFPDDCQFSGWFLNCPDFSGWLPIFRMISKLSEFSRWLPIFQMISKLSGYFQMTANFPDDFKTIRIFSDDCQFFGCFQNCPDFSRCRG